MFAAVRAAVSTSNATTNLQLRDFPTLSHVIGWIRDKTSAPAADVTAPRATDAVRRRRHRADQRGCIRATIAGSFDAVDRLPRRVPGAGAAPALEQCVPTGVALGTGARVVVMRDEGGVGDALLKRLDKAGATALPLDAGTPTDRLLEQVDAWRAEGEIAGVYWLAALDDEGRHEALDLDGWREALRRRVKALYATMRRLYDDSPFLVAATRLGGFHGYDAGRRHRADGRRRHRVRQVVQAGASGRAGQGRRPADGRATSRKTAAIADILIAETLTDPGCVEVGHVDGQRWGVGLATRPFPPQDGSRRRGHDPGRRAARSSSPARRAASSQRSRPTSHGPRARRSTCSTSPRSPIRVIPTWRSTSPTRTGSRPIVATRMKDRGRAAHPGGDREGAGPVRAAGRGARRHRRRPRRRRRRALPLRRPHGRRGGGRGARRRIRRTADRIDLLAARGRHGDQPRPAGQGARASSTSSSA